MTMQSQSSQSLAAGQADFGATHWSLVLAAAQTHSPEAEAALETLCREYWYPLYAYLRRKGCTAHEAEDLTQEFFSRRIVTKLIFRGVQPGQGKFRTWLLNSLQNFLRNEWDRQQAQKRGGQHTHLPLDLQDAEGRYVVEPGHDLTPEKIYERTWAMSLLANTLTELRARYQRAEKGELFEELKSFLPGALSSRPYAEVATRLGKTEQAVKMAVSRLRQEYGTLLRAQIERTVSNPTEAREELRHLFTVWVGES